MNIKTLTITAIAIAQGAVASPVPLTLHATGDTDRIMPQSISYRHPVDAYETINQETGETQQVAAVDAAVVIDASYQLAPAITVVDVSLSGIRTEIAPVSAPTFSLRITVPVDQFKSLFVGDSDGLIAVLQQAGSIQPNGPLVDLIRAIAAQILGAS